MPRHDFAVTFDYRCPFARNAHEHVVAALQAGAEWDVRFVPFSLGQTKVAEGEPDVWDDPGRDSGLLALQVGVAVRDTQPDRFLVAHRALFSLRHDASRDLRDEATLREALAEVDVDVDAVFDHVASGAALEAVRKEHEAASSEHDVFGVPTFIADGRAVFIRLMNRASDGAESRRAVERIVDLLTGWPELNEFKHTSIAR